MLLQKSAPCHPLGASARPAPYRRVLFGCAGEAPAGVVLRYCGLPFPASHNYPAPTQRRWQGCLLRERNPRPSGKRARDDEIRLRGPSRAAPKYVLLLAGVLMGVIREEGGRGGHGAGGRRALAASSGPTPLEESEEAPTSSCWLTEGKDNRRVEMTKVVLLYRTNLSYSVKTRPWCIRI